MGDTDRPGWPWSSETDTTHDQPATSRDWEWLQKHPNPTRDLGYEHKELDVIEIEDSERLLFIPQEESMGESDSFVIIDQDDVVVPEA